MSLARTRDLQSRREWLLRTTSVVSGAWLARASSLHAASAPTASVSIARCMTYDPAELLATMEKMFDRIGGLRSLVSGKTVGIKVNLTGEPETRLKDLPVGDTTYTHPEVIAATVHLIGKAGARRIRVLEGAWSSAGPLEEFMARANWQPRDILGAAPNVEFENTNNLGSGKQYARLKVPSGGLLFPAYDLNHSYEDCDVFVSLAKLKEHTIAGVTLSMKNSFGITPVSIYGSGAGKDGPDEDPKSSRQTLHTGRVPPAKTAPAENDPTSPREVGYRVPRATVDLVAARPIDLAIVEGIRTMTGGEVPRARDANTFVSPGVIVAGRNPVTTDAVCMAVMNFDPMADRGTPPFEACDSTMRLAEQAGIGTRDLKRIEVVGARIDQVRFDFAGIRKQRRTAKT